VLETPLLPAHLGETFIKLGDRKLPLLVRPTDPVQQRIEIVPPDGLRLQPAPKLEIASRWGRYVRSERLEGATLVREERIELERARVAPADYAEFARFVTGIDAAQAAQLRISSP
jgi:hypothetical protein